MGAQLDALKAEVKSKESIIEKLMFEKTELKIQFDQFEVQNNQQKERMAVMERKLEEAQKVHKNM